MTKPQHMIALKQANDVRYARARIKRDLKANRRTIGQLALDTPSELENATVFEMIIELKQYGRTRALRITKQIPISERTTFGDLTLRQREVLASLL